MVREQAVDLRGPGEGARGPQGFFYRWSSTQWTLQCRLTPCDCRTHTGVLHSPFDVLWHCCFFSVKVTMHLNFFSIIVDL